MSSWWQFCSQSQNMIVTSGGLAAKAGSRAWSTHPSAKASGGRPSRRLAVCAVGLSAEPKVGRAELRGRKRQGLEELQARFIPRASAAARPADATRAAGLFRAKLL